MNVFLDTNAFYNNWFVDNANFNLLFNYLNNERLSLILSELVVQEVNNIQGRESREAILDIEVAKKKLYKLNRYESFARNDDIDIPHYDIFSILGDKVDFLKKIDYEKIPHSEVVNRALNIKKPFTEGEKGYRDTLIWLSFIKFLKITNVKGDVAFITNNKSDFFEGKGEKLSLHPDLVRDVENIGLEATIHPYRNIYDFLNHNVDRVEHSFERQLLLDGHENFLISGTIDYLEGLDNAGLSDLFDNNIFSDKLTTVINISSNVYEGLEDDFIHYVSKLDNDSVYVSFNYEMKGVDLIISINSVEFKQYASEIESLPHLYNIEHDGEIVKLSFNFQVDFDAALEYQTKSKECSNLTIHYSKVMR
ncbi:TPA: PIN domain-containing protein [Vibrio alginolyticus]